MNSGRLAGKTVLITAAAQGIGRASALACAREGAEVVATDIHAGFLDSLRLEHPSIRTALLDVRSTEAVNALAAELPALDALFNCAGMVANGSVLDCAEADWDLSFDLNVKSMFRMTRAFLPGMLAKAAAEQGRVSIINMASMASSIKGFGNRCAYGASKAALDLMCRDWAEEIRNVTNIKVMLVNPGRTRTRMRAEAAPGAGRRRPRPGRPRPARQRTRRTSLRTP